jgi:hypothetical protein
LRDAAAALSTIDSGVCERIAQMLNVVWWVSARSAIFAISARLVDVSAWVEICPKNACPLASGAM